MRADWISKTDMGNNTFSKKCGNPLAGSINKLIDDDDMTRGNVFFHGTDRKNSLNAQQFHGINIRTEIDFGWGIDMTPAVTRQKGNCLSIQLAYYNGIGGFSKRSFDPFFFQNLKPFHLIEPTPPNDTNFDLRHKNLPTPPPVSRQRRWLFWPINRWWGLISRLA